MFARQDLARDPAAVVELFERHRLLVRRDLKDRVSARVDDPLARPLMLLAELLDDLGAARRLVAEDAAARAVHERVDHLVGEAERIRRHRLGRHHAHQLPVAGRRVLALRPLEEPAGDRRRAGLRRAALERLDVPEPECLERRQIEAADGAGDVRERVRALVAELGRIRQLSRPDGVEHDDARPGHIGLSYFRDRGARSDRHRRVHRRHAGPVRKRDVARRADQPETQGSLRGRPQAACSRGRAPRRPPRTSACRRSR